MNSRDVRNMTKYDFERAWLRGNPSEGKKTFIDNYVLPSFDDTTLGKNTNLQQKVANFLEQVEAIEESASRR